VKILSDASATSSTVTTAHHCNWPILHPRNHGRSTLTMGMNATHSDPFDVLNKELANPTLTLRPSSRHRIYKYMHMDAYFRPDDHILYHVFMYASTMFIKKR
jgi:hypothetical protein